MEYKHTYCAYWLQQHLNYISSSSYSHCISDMNKKSEQICNKYISSLLTSNSNKFEKHNAIYGGGRHQDSVNGDIVYNFADFFEDKKILMKKMWIQNILMNQISMIMIQITL